MCSDKACFSLLGIFCVVNTDLQYVKPWRKRKKIKVDATFAGVGSMVRGRGPHVEMWPGAPNNLKTALSC